MTDQNMPPQMPPQGAPQAPPPPVMMMPPPQKSGTSVWVILLIVGVCGFFLLAVLAAFLLPALAKAQEAARRAACMNNVRQIGLAMIQYAADNDDSFPYLVTPDGDTVPGYDSNNETTSREPARSAFALLMQKGYLTTNKVFVCPSANDHLPGDFPYDYRNAELQELILDEQCCSYGWDPTKRHSADATCAIIADKPSPNVSPQNQGAADNNSDNHDSEGQNVMYNDGHVKWGTTSRPDAGDDQDIYVGDAGYETSNTDAKSIR